MKALSVSLAFLFATTAFAADVSLIRRSVVKVVSKIQGVSAELRGSGLLFQRNGKRYVLTSDHVVGHTNGMFGEHTAQSAVSGEKLKLKFLASEWGNGLALLGVEGDQHPEDAVPFADLAAESQAKVGDRVSFYGYPFESDDLTEETFARLLSLAAPVPYYVFARNLVELEAAVGEFGMSGGAAFGPGDRFLGVLAYQRVVEESRENRVYTIPPQVVVAWLDHYFKVTEQYIPYFSEPWFAQGDPRQLLLTNDGLLLMFRVFEGKYRLGLGRVEQLIVLQDGPSIPYEDPRGFMKFFRQYVKDNPWRPAEYGVIDRASGKPVLKGIHYPAEVFTSFDRPETSLFVVFGERHEERYDRVHPIVQRLETAVGELTAKMKGSPSAEWKELADDLAVLLKKLAAMPPTPSDPGTPGANEFFSAAWLSDVVFQIENNAGLKGWQQADTHAAAGAAAVKQALRDLVEGFKVSEIEGS